MSIVFITGIVEVTINKINYDMKVINIDTSVIDSNFITPYLSLVQSTIYEALKNRFNPDSTYNVMFCGVLHKDKKEFSILESEVCNLKIEDDNEELSLNPFIES